MNILYNTFAQTTHFYLNTQLQEPKLIVVFYCLNNYYNIYIKACSIRRDSRT